MLIPTFNHTDINVFMSNTYMLADKKQFEVEELGKVGNESIILLNRTQNSEATPHLLVAAGFHGEEIAGCWGILKLLDTVSQELLQRINLSFIPLVNPTGFKKNQRLNDWGENPNSAFCHTLSGNAEVSKEGMILLNHVERLKQMARDGFISLHEDIDEKRFYLYTFEHSDSPSDFSEVLLQTASEFFEIKVDGVIESQTILNGLIFNACDGSFEDFLYHQGIPKTACTETPGQLDINRRINANANIINAIIKLLISRGVRRMSFFQNLTTKKKSFLFLGSFNLGIPLTMCQTDKSYTWDALKVELLEKFTAIPKFKVILDKFIPTIDYHHDLLESYSETKFPLGEPIILLYNEFLKIFDLPKSLENIGIIIPDIKFDHLIWICRTGIVLIIGKISFDIENAINLSQWNDDIVEKHYEELSFIFLEVARVIFDSLPEQIQYSSFARQSDIENYKKAVCYLNKYKYSNNNLNLSTFIDDNKEVKSLFNDILIDVYYIEFIFSKKEKNYKIDYVNSSITDSDPSYVYCLCVAYSSFPCFVWITRHLSEQSTILHESFIGTLKLYDNLLVEIKLFRIFCLKFINESSPISIRLTREYMELIEIFWDVSRLHKLRDQINDQLTTIETILEWIDNNKKELRNFKIGLAATLIALVSLTSVVASLISTIDFTKQITAALRIWYIITGFLIGFICSIIIYLLPVSQLYARLILKRKSHAK